MKKTKGESGITLVALIITIIVLLILAIVSIRAISEGGILGKSQNAVNSYEDKRKLEENRMDEYENLIDRYNVDNPDKPDDSIPTVSGIYYSPDANVAFYFNGNSVTEYFGLMGSWMEMGTSNYEIIKKINVPIIEEDVTSYKQTGTRDIENAINTSDNISGMAWLSGS